MEEHKIIAFGIFSGSFIVNLMMIRLETPFLRDMRKIFIDGPLLGLGMIGCYMWYADRNR